MNAILEAVEEILDGAELEVIDLPVIDFPECMPIVSGPPQGGSNC